MVGERDDFPVLGGLGQIGVGVDEVVGAGVLGEERQYGAGALAAGGYVVFFQGGIASPVHDGVEVQVEDGLLGGGEPGVDHPGVQSGQELALVLVGQPVGVVGQGGFLWQAGQAGEQGGAGVDEQVVIDVGDAAGAGEFERQQ